MNYNILTPLIPFFMGIIFKIFLDFNLAFFIVKYLFWLPDRGIYRTKPEYISGDWKQLWDSKDSEKYKEDVGRESQVKLRQFGKYIYGEFRSKNDEEYYVFGELIGKNIIGKWGDRKNSLGYFGAYELRIVDKEKMEGTWLGHSNIEPDKIRSGSWTWTKK